MLQVLQINPLRDIFVVQSHLIGKVAQVGHSETGKRPFVSGLHLGENGVYIWRQQRLVTAQKSLRIIVSVPQTQVSIDLQFEKKVHVGPSDREYSEMDLETYPRTPKI